MMRPYHNHPVRSFDRTPLLEEEGTKKNVGPAAAERNLFSLEPQGSTPFGEREVSEGKTGTGFSSEVTNV
jgi:hypothetical protein